MDCSRKDIKESLRKYPYIPVYFRKPYIIALSGYTIFKKNQEATMKVTDKKKSIATAPKGAWESGIINDREHRFKKQQPNDLTTDSQGNGYPVSKKCQDG